MKLHIKEDELDDKFIPTSWTSEQELSDNILVKKFEIIRACIAGIDNYDGNVILRSLNNLMFLYREQHLYYLNELLDVTDGEGEIEVSDDLDFTESLDKIKENVFQDLFNYAIEVTKTGINEYTEMEEKILELLHYLSDKIYDVICKELVFLHKKD